MGPLRTDRLFPDTGEIHLVPTAMVLPFPASTASVLKPKAVSVPIQLEYPNSEIDAG